MYYTTYVESYSCTGWYFQFLSTSEAYVVVDYPVVYSGKILKWKMLHLRAQRIELKEASRYVVMQIESGELPKFFGVNGSLTTSTGFLMYFESGECNWIFPIMYRGRQIGLVEIDQKGEISSVRRTSTLFKTDEEEASRNLSAGLERVLPKPVYLAFKATKSDLEGSL
jgi:hypothetical protein